MASVLILVMLTMLGAVTPAQAGAAGLAPLTDSPGDAVRGRAIVADRRRSFCLLCHRGPFPEERFMGDLAPPLDGAGSRWSQAQLRERLVDAARLNPDTIMPPYFREQGFNRLAPSWRGRTILTAQEIEDVVAFLASLKD